MEELDVFKPEILGQVKETFSGILKETKAPGLSYALIQNNKVHSECLGFSDLENKKTGDGNTAFFIGSCSKSVCCLAIMRLVEDKKLSLDDPVDKYIPLKWTRKFDQALTIHHLMSQISGIPDLGVASVSIVSRLFGKEEAKEKYELSTSEKYVEHMNGAGKFVTKPGTFRYCNSNFGILQLIVEKVSGMKFEKYVHENLFSKLGMNNSVYTEQDASRMIKDRSKCYYLEKDKKSGDTKIIPKDFVFDWYAYGAGGVLTTVNDLCKYVISLMEGGKGLGISEENFGKIFTQHVRDIDIIEETGLTEFGGGYGYGWFIVENFFGQELILHPGDLCVGSALIAFLPKLKLGVCVASNSDVNEKVIPSTFGLLASMLGKSPMSFRNFSEVMFMQKLCGTYEAYVKEEYFVVFQKQMGGELYVKQKHFAGDSFQDEQVLHPMGKYDGGCLEYFARSAPAGFSRYRFVEEDDEMKLLTGKYVLFKKKEKMEE